MFLAFLIIGIALCVAGTMTSVGLSNPWPLLLIPPGVFLYVISMVGFVQSTDASARISNVKDTLAHEKSFDHVCAELHGKDVTITLVPKDDNYSFICIKDSTVLYKIEG